MQNYKTSKSDYQTEPGIPTFQRDEIDLSHLDPEMVDYFSKRKRLNILVPVNIPKDNKPTKSYPKDETTSKSSR